MILARKYLRVLVTIGLTLLSFGTGVGILSANIEFTGALLIMLAFCTIAFAPARWILKKWKLVKYIPRRMRNKWKVLSSLLVAICCIGAMESLEKFPVLTLVFIELLLFILLFRLLNYYLQKKGIDTTGNSILYNYSFWYISISIIILVLVLIENNQEAEALTLATAYFILLFILALGWVIRQFQELIKLKNEKATTELLHLKSQVNPHFFFNMLNNLYGWIGKDQKTAQTLILKLSDMMRYSIYEGQADWVKLEDEVAYLKNYVSLHKMRYHKTIDIRFKANFEAESYKVMPLLFIILVENAFKHGVENLRENAYVEIDLSTKGKTIFFEVENNFDDMELPGGSGIGLQNLKRRLELVYPGAHHLSFQITENTYNAQLRLDSL